MENPPAYCTKVKVSGVDEMGHKELFNDFIGEFIAVSKNPRWGRNAEWLISNTEGHSIYGVHPSQVSLI
jgi:hypothetical protein